MPNPDVIITGRHIDLTDSLKHIVHEKAEKLFNHDDQIIRFRVELEYNQNVTNLKEFIAKGHIEMRGPGLNVTAETEDLYKSVDEMVNKLDRMLRRKHRLSKVKRKDTQSVEIPADIPKVASA
jgi:putative sigma-54 modulation protein